MNPKNKLNTNRQNLRYLKTLDWLNGISGNCLNIAEGGYLSQMIQDKFGIELKDTSVDLDYLDSEALGVKKYDHIFCFEVMEHLINVGNFMLSVRHSLKEGGFLYISTPQRPGFLRNQETHFHEFKWNELAFLIDWSGFEIVEKRVINPSSLRFLAKNLYKVRVILIFLFSRTVLLKLKSKETFNGVEAFILPVSSV